MSRKKKGKGGDNNRKCESRGFLTDTKGAYAGTQEERAGGKGCRKIFRPSRAQTGRANPVKINKKKKPGRGRRSPDGAMLSIETVEP